MAYTLRYSDYPGGTSASSTGSVLMTSASDPALTILPCGSLYWDTDMGQLFIKYCDGTSQQWVIACSLRAPGH